MGIISSRSPGISLAHLGNSLSASAERSTKRTLKTISTRWGTSMVWIDTMKRLISSKFWSKCALVKWQQGLNSMHPRGFYYSYSVTKSSPQMRVTFCWLTTLSSSKTATSLMLWLRRSPWEKYRRWWRLSKTTKYILWLRGCWRAFIPRTREN